MRDNYCRRARVQRVVDGDTLDMTVDLGYYVVAVHRMRLLGVDTPELRGTSGQEYARAVAAEMYTSAWVREHAAHGVDPSWPFVVESRRADSFGRFLASVTCGEGHNLNGDLVRDGHARRV